MSFRPEISYGLAWCSGMNCVTISLYWLAFQPIACKTIAWFKPHQNWQYKKINCIHYILKPRVESPNKINYNSTYPCNKRSYLVYCVTLFIYILSVQIFSMMCSIKTAITVLLCITTGLYFKLLEWYLATDTKVALGFIPQIYEAI